MAVVVELPRLSDTMEEGTVAAWKVEVGDSVKRGQVIAEIETDKATMEFESFDPGTVLALVAPTGKTLPIGTPIAVLGKPGEDPQSVLSKYDMPSAPAAPAPNGAATAAPVGAPVGGSGGSGGTNAQAGSPAAPLGTPAPVPTPAKEAQNNVLSLTPAVSGDERRIPASPVARKLARESGLDLRSIEGSGPHGRVVKQDVERAAQGSGAQGEGAAPAAFSPERDDLGRPYVSRPSRQTPLTQMRKAIARRMTQSQQEVPHFYLTIDIDMDAAAKMRAEYNLAISGAKVSYNDILVLAVAKALRDNPRCNASYTPEGMIEHGDVHVGVAVAIEDGLVVPVVRYTEQKSLKAISLEIRDLGKRAKKKALRPDEMSGSTFTVSNLGMFGIDSFSAVVNPGEGGILAVGAVADAPVVEDGQLVVKKRMKATLSCDHRVIDGAVGAVFLQSLQEYLEVPMKLFT